MAQTAVPDASGRLVFKANARSVVIDVVVTDRKGKPVERLPKQDFIVAEDGHPEPVNFFEEHSGTQAAPTKLPDLPPDIFTNIPRVKPVDSVTVLLLDGLNTQLQDQSVVRRQMLKYLKNIQPGRRVAIFTLGTRLRFIQGFTDNPAVLAAALNNPKSGAGPQSSPLLLSNGEIAAQQQGPSLLAADTQSPVAQAMLQALVQFQAEQNASQNDMRVSMTLEALEELAHYLAGIPGRKNLAWFSSAFPSVLFVDPNLKDDPFAAQRDYSEKVKKTDALLAAAQVAIYPIAAEGLGTDSLYDADHQVSMVPNSSTAANAPGSAPGETQAQMAQQQQVQTMQSDSLQRNANHTTMEDIARETGGEAFFNTNGLDDALAKVEDHGSYYYTISYTPTDVAPNGKFRKIQVKLANNDGYKLAYRRGYYAPDAKEVQMAAAKPSGDPLHPFMGPGMPDSTQIPLALRVLRGATQPGTDSAPQAKSPAAGQAHGGDNPNLKGPLTRYSVDFVIAARGLQLDPTPDGGRHGDIESTIVVYDRDARPVNWIVRQLDLDMDAKRYAAVQENGVNFRLEIDVPTTGVFLRAGIYDTLSNLVGTLEVPFSGVVDPPMASAKAQPAKQ